VWGGEGEGGGKVGVRWEGGWGGVSVLPRAQERCGRGLGSSGTGSLEFYCEPARAWHSHESEYGRTEGRKGGSRRGSEEGGESRRRGSEEEEEGEGGGGDEEE